ncbi:M56 family metallopeptidase [Tissierella sp. MSJ-40]|uniref:M56 family metallopeptidase n=1 Tax=Tissierella simiarum TaxID=2841534 RepID=A0ABS6EBL2_9FIRM|nr:M56 family metallopeptidase [Tissierella simiarum]MBU5439553.1 M56 family metallopeptidase [Tissierella simiarum]
MHKFLIALFKCSISMSVLSLLYILLTPFLAKRYTAKWLYYSWLIIVIGFIVPLRPNIKIPILQIKETIAPYYIEQITLKNVIEDIVQTEAISHSIWMTPWYWWIGILWIIGVIGCSSYHIIRHRRFIRIAKRWSEEITEPTILDIVQHLQVELKIYNQTKLLFCSCITSPMMIGFSKPVILLPSKNVPVDELSFILKHELVHFKRKDLWYKGLIFLAVVINWFNPIVYLMARAIAVQCEISCDVEVVKDANIYKRQQYSETIISAIKNQSRIQTSFSTSFYGSKEGMKNRIFSIMDMKKKKAGIMIICLVIIGVMITGMTFTTSANIEAIEDNTQLNGQTEEYNMTVSYFDEETGETFYSWDDGATWVLMTDEEYEAKFPTTDIEWWTYDGYKAWLDTEKVELQNIIGERGWNSTEGWYVWTQEMVDETIQMYEQILQDIKNGVMVSKSVDGDENIVISYDPKNIKVDTSSGCSFSIENGKGGL